LQRNYEKLELLGDAILDYLANTNLLRFTLFERYLSPSSYYRQGDDFNCADAHQAKCQLVKNEILSKFTVLMGLHKYVIFYNTTEGELSTKDVDDYLQFSHKKNFDLNQREIEPFEAPKILGDIFESVLGAVYEDGGMAAVYIAYKELLSPFILYVAKYSKDVYKEPKEQFIIRCGRDYKLRPLF
jgi:dsRNA-specific ribonuclease